MRSVKEFWAIDFDRCIGNVPTIYSLFERLLISTFPDFDIPALESTRFELESAGGSFDMLSYVKQHTADEAADELVLRTFLIEAAQIRDSLLMPGVHEVLHYLERQSLPYGIVSFGHKDWQTLKIAATGLGDVSRLILDQSRKGEVIATWQGPNGFVIPAALSGGSELVSQSIVLIDDKAVSFTGLPEHARGYWVQSAALLPSQQGSIPASVTPIGRLDDVITIEESRRH